MNQPDSETVAKLLAKGYKPHRPKHKPGGISRDPEDIKFLNRYFKKQMDWWVSPSGEVVHCKKAMEGIG